METVHVAVDAASDLGPLDRIWRSFGYDELNWTYTPGGRAVFKAIGGLGDGPYWIRNHNAFTSGDTLSREFWGSTNCYTEDERHVPRYDWSVNDRIYDVYLENGCKPMIELDFMPHDLSRFKETGPKESWRYPPRDYGRWRELNARFARHLIDRYGKTEVRQWYFSSWNEPDLEYFQSEPGQTPRKESGEQLAARCAEFCRLHDHAAAGLRDADGGLRIGGPDLACRTDFLELFLRHCSEGVNTVDGSRGSRLDFISLHAKGTGLVDGRVPPPDFDKMVRREFLRYGAVIGRFAGFRDLPLVCNEWDIDVGTANGLHHSPDFAYRNGSYYPTFVIRSVKEILDLKAAGTANVGLITQWAFYFEGKRCFEGTRALFDPLGIRKPVFNGFEMLSRLGGTRLALASDDTEDDIAVGQCGGNGKARRTRGDEADGEMTAWDVIKPHRRVDGLAARTSGEVQVLVWNQEYDQYAEGVREIGLEVAGLRGWKRATVLHYRIDGRHSNASTPWVGMSRPDWPTESQIAAIREREGLEKYCVDRLTDVEGECVSLRFPLPVHGVSLLIVRKEDR